MPPKKYKKTCIDNMLVKSMTFEHIQDLHEVFSILYIRPMYWLPR